MELRSVSAAQEVPPGYDPVPETKPKTKAVKRNERKKEKWLQILQIGCTSNHLQKLQLSIQLTTPLGHIFKPHQAKYKETLKTKYGEDLSFAPSIDRSTWLEAVGGAKKGRVVGTGEFSPKFIESIHSASFVTSTSRNPTDKEPLEAVERRLDAFQEQMSVVQNQLGYML
ncbi:hypothetical protein Tsubulata_004463 [Turnera subulata]|uniref:Uncharacterized protein n=1 Tax=Turnera subulata TaxID=218843 RepID=A0A9Q0GI22_9ROSI|nr:hypothetical protein Tsubulata_004463 [Turnera subulata]